MTTASMARFLMALYAEAGIAGVSSHSGQRTLIMRLAECVIDQERSRGSRDAPGSARQQCTWKPTGGGSRASYTR
jgi:hypothetical protein